MADQQPQESNTLSSTFPNPPPFWKDFAPDKIARVEALRTQHVQQQHGGGDAATTTTTTTRIPGLPEELVNLQPPAEPADGRWRVFGDTYMLDDKLPTLEEQGITNLPSTSHPSDRDAKHFDRALELKRLAKSLLLNFLELNGVLSRVPAHAEAKVQDLRTLFINFHHILNEYRPHQARESAIALMQEHLDRTRTETMAIRAAVDRARRVLDGLGSLSVPEGEGEGGLGVKEEAKAEEGGRVGDGDGKGKDGDADGVRRQREKDVWAFVDEQFL